MNINFYKNIIGSNDKLDPVVYKEFFAKQLILRDYLAIERTILTNEATYLGYIRTSLTVMVVGITLFKLSADNTFLHVLSIIITVIGFFILVIGSTRTIEMHKKIMKFLDKKDKIENQTHPDPLD